MIKASILLAIVGGAMPWLRRRSAAERHLVWTATLGAAAVPPAPGRVRPVVATGLGRQLMTVMPVSWAPGASAGASGDVDVVVRAIGIEATRTAVDQLVPVVWAGGAVLTLLLLIAQVVALARLTASARPVTDGRSVAIAADVADALHLARPIRLLQSHRDIVPGTWGARNPRVMLPACAAHWSDDRLRAVLSHELAHVRRNDWAVHLLAEVICAIYWFHPLFWIAKRGACRESEQAADDVVLGLGVESGEYAGHLLEIVRAARMPAAAWAAGVRDGRAFASRTAIRRAAERVRQSRRDDTAENGRGGGHHTAAGGSSRDDEPARRGHEHHHPDRFAATDGHGGGLEPGPTVTAVRSVRIVGLRDTANAVTRPEIIEYTTPPLYSDEARSRGVEGVVTVGARVESDGQVSAVRVVRGLGFGLDQNAVVALRQWRFRPGTRTGLPVAMDAEIDIEFSLRNDAVNALIANDMATRVGPGVTPPSAVRVFGLWPRHPKIRGTVVLDVVLLEDGTPKIVRILQSLDPELDERAVRNFEQWRFSPAIKNGRPVKVRMNAEVNFHG